MFVIHRIIPCYFMIHQVQRINMSSMVVDRLLGETDELKVPLYV